jgi:hypothetical protein
MDKVEGSAGRRKAHTFIRFVSVPSSPSGMSLVARPSMSSWALRRKRDLFDLFAVDGRCRRSGGLQS